jgi:ABC-type molybdate transport system permease subunit
VLVCAGILAVQLVTVTMAGYAFARLRFPGCDTVFVLFLLQLLLVPTLLIAPNLTTIVALGLYDRLPGIMAPYFASAFGVFLMRQAFRAIPRDFEEAAMLDGAGVFALIRHVLVPLARPSLVAFAIVSVTFHWNEFLWPLMAVSSPSRQVLTVGLASFASGSEAGGECSRLAPCLWLDRCFWRSWCSSAALSVPSCSPVSKDEGSFNADHRVSDNATGRAGDSHRRLGGRTCDACTRSDRDRDVFSGPGAGKAGDRDAAPDRCIQHPAPGHQSHPRLHRQLR